MKNVSSSKIQDFKSGLFKHFLAKDPNIFFDFLRFSPPEFRVANFDFFLKCFKGPSIFFSNVSPVFFFSVDLLWIFKNFSPRIFRGVSMDFFRNFPEELLRPFKLFFLKDWGNFLGIVSVYILFYIFSANGL